MLRGTKVKVTDREYRVGKRGKLYTMPEHLVGHEGIALERMKNSGYIRVLQPYEGFLCDPCYPEEVLDIIEPPIEI